MGVLLLFVADGAEVGVEGYGEGMDLGGEIVLVIVVIVVVGITIGLGSNKGLEQRNALTIRTRRLNEIIGREVGIATFFVGDSG